MSNETATSTVCTLSSVNWSFLLDHSTWPLPHIHIPYLLYLYTKDLAITLLWVYIWESIEILVLLIFGQFNVFFLGEKELTGSSPIEPHGEVLIGEQLSGLIGIIIGILHVWLFSNYAPYIGYDHLHQHRTRGHHHHEFEVDEDDLTYCGPRCHVKKYAWWRAWLQFLVLITPPSALFAIHIVVGDNTRFQVGLYIYLGWFLLLVPILAWVNYQRRFDRIRHFKFYLLLYLISAVMIGVMLAAPMLQPYFLTWIAGGGIIIVLLMLKAIFNPLG